jgi:methylated-DNA-[protein]-cysteine S-methyltransferase
MMPKAMKVRRNIPELSYRVFKTRMGWCGVVGGRGGIVNVILPMTSQGRVEKVIAHTWGKWRLAPWRHRRSLPLKARGILAEAERQIREYFAGRLRSFSLRVRLLGRGAFERAIYEATRRIPYGETVSYGWIAWKVGNPQAARAVGRAMARNPVPLLIPCHRVLGSNGKLCGFTSEGGLRLKQKLLDLEKRARH